MGAAVAGRLATKHKISSPAAIARLAMVSEMIQMTRAPRAQLTAYEVGDLKIKILEQTENFATVRYNHEYSAAVGNTKTAGTMESHTTLVTANIGWQFLYQAVLQ